MKNSDFIEIKIIVLYLYRYKFNLKKFFNIALVVVSRRFQWLPREIPLKEFYKETPQSRRFVTLQRLSLISGSFLLLLTIKICYHNYWMIELFVFFIEMHTRTQQTWQTLQILVSNERMNSIKQKVTNQFLHTSAQVRLMLWANDNRTQDGMIIFFFFSFWVWGRVSKFASFWKIWVKKLWMELTSRFCTTLNIIT